MNDETVQRLVDVIDDQLETMRELCDTLDRLTRWVQGGDPFPEDDS